MFADQRVDIFAAGVEFGCFESLKELFLADKALLFCELSQKGVSENVLHDYLNTIKMISRICQLNG